MSQHVEWAAAHHAVEWIDDAEWEDPYGTKIDADKIGVWVSESVLIEGTIADFRGLIARLSAEVDRAEQAT